MGVPARTARFGHLSIAYDERVLTPRAWTANQAVWAAALAADAPPGPILELCAGAGHIGLLAVAGTTRRLLAVDLDPVACDFGRLNAAAAGLHDQVEIRQGSLAEALSAAERFALVVADPPWVPRAEVARFPEDPVLAIDGGDDGLEVARTCLTVAADHLLPAGNLLIQLGTLAQVEDLGSIPGLELVEVRQYAGGVVARLDRSLDQNWERTRLPAVPVRDGASRAAPCESRRTREDDRSAHTGTPR